MKSFKYEGTLTIEVHVEGIIDAEEKEDAYEALRKRAKVGDLDTQVPYAHERILHAVMIEEA